MSKIAVLVTGAGGGGIGEQTIKCLRLSSLEFIIVSTDVTEISKGKIDADKFIVAPIVSDANYLSFILEVCAKNEIRAIIPGSEAELKFYSGNRSIFYERKIELLINGESVIKICLDKILTSDFLSKNKFASPKSFPVSHHSQFNIIDIYPLVLKPSVGGGGSANTFIAQNEEELKVFGQFLLTQYPEFIAQEYVGDANSEFTVGVLSLSDGKIVDSIVLRRNILSGLGSKLKIINTSNKPELGKYLAISSGISQGEIVRNELISNTCEEVAKAIGSTGPLNIQCRLVEGRVFIFEINPRFSGTSPMRALAGFNEVEISIKDRILKMRNFTRIDYKLGNVVRGLIEYFV